jgi:hypothetical protein
MTLAPNMAEAALAVGLIDCLDLVVRQSYNPSMSVMRPKSTDSQKASLLSAKREGLARGLPGTDRERAEQRRRFAKEHRETLRRLGK